MKKQLIYDFLKIILYSGLGVLGMFIFTETQTTEGITPEPTLEIQYATVDTTIHNRRSIRFIEEDMISLDGGSTWLLLTKRGKVRGSVYLHRKYNRFYEDLPITLTQSKYCYDTRY